MTGWYWNSVKAWRDELQKRHRRLMAQHAKAMHPASPLLGDYGKLVDLNAKLIRIMDEELDREHRIR